MVEQPVWEMLGTTPFYEWISLGSVHSLRQYWSVEAEAFSIKLAYAWSLPLVLFLASFHVYKLGSKAVKPMCKADGICEGSGGMCEGSEHIVGP